MAAGYRMEQFVSTFSASGHPPKETCRQCRFRKVRCDGRRGEKACGDCDRLKFDCSFVTDSAPSTPATTTTTATLTVGGRFSPPAKVGDNKHGAALASPTSATYSSGTDATRVVERRRTSKACTHCRQQKVRCSGGAPCLPCKKKGVSCVYGTDRRRASRVTTTTTTTTTAKIPTGHTSIAGTLTDGSVPPDEPQEAADDTSTTSPTTPGTIHSEPITVTHAQVRTGPPLLLPPDLQVLVEFYFHHVYPLPSYAFLHPSTTIRQCSEASLEACLSYAICAVASHHRGPVQASQASVEQGWIQAAEDSIWKHLESPSLARVQALLLIVLYRIETGTVQRAFMLLSLAARMAAALRLNHERTTASNLESSRISLEVRRRTMWSLKLVERYFSMGLPEFELCPVDSIYLNLPCWEQEFSSSASSTGVAEGGSAERSLQTCDWGSYHLYIKLEMLRRDIMKLTRSLAVCNDAASSSSSSSIPPLPSVMSDFEHQLRRVGTELPHGPTLTRDRIAQLVGTPSLPRQILVYLSYHQCHCDLYRLLLRGYREAAPAPVLDALDPALLVHAEQLCLQHATAVADILATLNHQSPRAQLLEFDTAICGYHATRLLLFIAQGASGRAGPTATRPSEEWALSRAELCLASLRRFFLHATLARPILEEMQRAIAVFSARSSAAATTPSRLASPGPPPSSSSSLPPTTCASSPNYYTAGGGGGGRNNHQHAKDAAGVSGLSAEARVRQRLAIHSLLRQADFTDDEDEPSPPPTAAQPPDEGATTRKPRGTSLAPHRGVSPGTADSDLSKASSTSWSRRSPRPPSLSLVADTPESWSLTWLTDREADDRQQDGGGGGGGGGGGEDALHAPGFGARRGTPSFLFPWLQRLEAHRGVNGK